MLKPLALVLLSVVALAGCGRVPSTGTLVAVRAKPEAAKPAVLGVVAGTVVDEAGRAVEGAIAQLEPAVTEAVKVDADGRFSLMRVPAGHYKLSVSAAGLCERTVAIKVGATPDAKLAGPLVLEAGGCQ